MTEVIHDGNEVRIQLGKVEMSEAEFSELLNIPRQTVSRMLNKENWTMENLSKAGEILQYNFVAKRLLGGSFYGGVVMQPQEGNTPPKVYVLTQLPWKGTMGELEGYLKWKLE